MDYNIGLSEDSRTGTKPEALYHWVDTFQVWENGQKTPWEICLTREEAETWIGECEFPEDFYIKENEVLMPID